MFISDNFTIPEPECTDPLQKPQDPCNPNYCRLHVCNNVRECIPTENCCECGEGKYYNGTHCVLEENCPCLDENGLIRYPGLIIISLHIVLNSSFTRSRLIYVSQITYRHKYNCLLSRLAFHNSEVMAYFIGT